MREKEAEKRARKPKIKKRWYRKREKKRVRQERKKKERDGARKRRRVRETISENLTRTYQRRYTSLSLFLTSFQISAIASLPSRFPLFLYSMCCLALSLYVSFSLAFSPLAREKDRSSIFFPLSLFFFCKPDLCILFSFPSMGVGRKHICSRTAAPCLALHNASLLTSSRRCPFPPTYSCPTVLKACHLASSILLPLSFTLNSGPSRFSVMLAARVAALRSVRTALRSLRHGRFLFFLCFSLVFFTIIFFLFYFSVAVCLFLSLSLQALRTRLGSSFFAAKTDNEDEK